MESPVAGRRLMLVVGAGRSGTSLITGVVNRLGYYVPQPEVMANATNPRGFGEPRWVVDFHARLMKARRISLLDARPDAWAAADRAAASPANVSTLREWLAGEFEGRDRLVVKDPRTSWFLPLWSATAADLGACPSFVTMLRHPSEVLTSIRTTAGEPPNESGRAAWWINMMLHTELLTRSAPRAYLHYERLLVDWRGELVRAGAALGDQAVADPPVEVAAGIDGLVDAGLRRAPAGWDGVAVTGTVRELAEETWQALTRLTEPEPEAAAQLRDELDLLRERYRRLYADAEAVARSSITAARDKARRAAPAANPPRPLPATSLRRRGARGLRTRWSRAGRSARRRFLR